MKKLLTLLSIPLVAITTACTNKEPVKKDYFPGYSTIDFWGHNNAIIEDFDSNGVADAIVDENRVAIFYAKGYEKQAHAIKSSIEMTPEVIKYASDFIKADNNLRYFTAKEEYDSLKAKYNTTGVKK